MDPAGRFRLFPSKIGEAPQDDIFVRPPAYPLPDEYLLDGETMDSDYLLTLLIKNVSKDIMLTEDEIHDLKGFRASLSPEEWDSWLKYARAEKKKLKKLHKSRSNETILTVGDTSTAESIEFPSPLTTAVSVGELLTPRVEESNETPAKVAKLSQRVAHNKVIEIPTVQPLATHRTRQKPSASLSGDIQQPMSLSARAATHHPAPQPPHQEQLPRYSEHDIPRDTDAFHHTREAEVQTPEPQAVADTTHHQHHHLPPRGRTHSPVRQSSAPISLPSPMTKPYKFQFPLQEQEHLPVDSSAATASTAATATEPTTAHLSHSVTHSTAPLVHPAPAVKLSSVHLSHSNQSVPETPTIEKALFQSARNATDTRDFRESPAVSRQPQTTRHVPTTAYSNGLFSSVKPPAETFNRETFVPRDIPRETPRETPSRESFRETSFTANETPNKFAHSFQQPVQLQVHQPVVALELDGVSLSLVRNRGRGRAQSAPRQRAHPGLSTTMLGMRAAGSVPTTGPASSSDVSFSLPPKPANNTMIPPNSVTKNTASSVGNYIPAPALAHSSSLHSSSAPHNTANKSAHNTSARSFTSFNQTPVKSAMQSEAETFTVPKLNQSGSPKKRLPDFFDPSEDHFSNRMAALKEKVSDRPRVEKPPQRHQYPQSASSADAVYSSAKVLLESFEADKQQAQLNSASNNSSAGNGVVAPSAATLETTMAVLLELMASLKQQKAEQLQQQQQPVELEEADVSDIIPTRKLSSESATPRLQQLQQQQQHQLRQQYTHQQQPSRSYVPVTLRSQRYNENPTETYSSAAAVDQSKLYEDEVDIEDNNEYGVVFEGEELNSLQDFPNGTHLNGSNRSSYVRDERNKNRQHYQQQQQQSQQQDNGRNEEELRQIYRNYYSTESKTTDDIGDKYGFLRGSNSSTAGGGFSPAKSLSWNTPSAVRAPSQDILRHTFSSSQLMQSKQEERQLRSGLDSLERYGESYRDMYNTTGGGNHSSSSSVVSSGTAAGRLSARDRNYMPDKSNRGASVVEFSRVTRVCIAQGSLIKAFEDYPIRVDAESAAVDVVWREAHPELYMHPSPIRTLRRPEVLRRERFLFDELFAGVQASENLSFFAAHRVRSALHSGVNMAFLCLACGERGAVPMEPTTALLIGNGNGGSGMIHSTIKEMLHFIRPSSTEYGRTTTRAGDTSYLAVKMAHEKLTTRLTLSVVAAEADGTVIDLLESSRASANNKSSNGVLHHTNGSSSRSNASLVDNAALRNALQVEIQSPGDFDRIAGMLIGKRLGSVSSGTDSGSNGAVGKRPAVPKPLHSFGSSDGEWRVNCEEPMSDSAADSVTIGPVSSTMLLRLRVRGGGVGKKRHAADMYFVCPYGPHWEKPANDINLLAEAISSLPHPPVPSILKCSPFTTQLLLGPGAATEFVNVISVCRPSGGSSGSDITSSGGAYDKVAEAALCSLRITSHIPTESMR